jgi:hypothetical protein
MYFIKIRFLSLPFYTGVIQFSVFTEGTQNFCSFII